MKRRLFYLLAGGLLAGLGVAWAAARDDQPAKAQSPQAANGAPAPQTDSDRKHDADRQAIHQAARAFVRAFNDGDAKAVAALWTEQAEFIDDSGAVLQGRAAIEKAYAEFFKAQPKARIAVQPDYVRFPAPNTAIEEGLLTLTLPGAELPTTTAYRAIQVREGDRWRIAFSQEWGADQAKVEDLAWLIGNWVARPVGREVQLTFAWNEKKTQIRNHFTVKEGGKVTSSGTQTIGIDPRTGQLASWTFDEDGSRGEAVWFRDGNRWVMDSTGVLPDGTETAAVNLITRLNDHEFLWRSVSRAVGADELPDTEPVKVVRGQAIRGPQNGGKEKP
jgi:uncharacterized protein (TIGR02246 family)